MRGARRAGGRGQGSDRERDAKSYVATGGGRRLDFEQEAVDLWERVQEALRHPLDRDL